ncbi:methylase [Theileria orientalis]|uniref:Methylase n=1 Tax=Theileria orientalis TaxID=68886 RepID=A0A976QQU1_THEOR|nr:methylase [Theileria orientalis]
MSVKGTGSNFSQAISNYLQRSEMCDSVVLHDFKDSFESSTVVSPLYVAINVRHTVDETFEYLKLFNNLNKEYLSLFLPFLEKSSFHKQNFTTSSSSKSDKSKLQTDELNSNLHEDHDGNTVFVLSDSEDIVLLEHFHVTLYYLGVDKKTEEMVSQDVQNVAQYLKDKDPNFRLMLNTLTLYEFSVCLMYRHLYKMPLPFERVTVSEEDDEHALFRYLVLVPGVVFFAIAELKKPLFAIPPKDFNQVKSTGASGSEFHNVTGLLEFLKNSVLVETEHSTHVTLGTSKDYKPVISNQICTSLLHFLNNCDSKHVHLYSDLKSQSSSPDLHTELNKYLHVYNSGECKYDNLKEVFLQSLPCLLNENPFAATESTEKVTLSEYSHPNKRSKRHVDGPSDKDLYSKTKVFVSDNHNWFYFSNLPATHSLHPERSAHPYDWNIDVYVISYQKEVRGNIHFNQK